LIKEQPPFYLAFGLFLLPSIKICQKFGAFKTMGVSLVCMFILGVSIPYMNISDSIYIALQIVFAFFLAGLVTPSLAVVYQLLKEANNIFDNIFWISFGSSVSMLFLAVGSRIGFMLHYPLTGMWIFAANILMCLLGILAYVRFEKNAHECLKKANSSNAESDASVMRPVEPNLKNSA
jgi:MFS family permease